MKHLRIENVAKYFGDEVILDNLTLDIPGGQFFALLGPSGCGKTTLLRLIAGLEAVDKGSIFLGDEDITNVPIYERKINTVFQNYALFPHLTVHENVSYSLNLRGVSREETKEKVYQVLKSVRLLGHEHKSISQISGGQQQRVALARALLGEPEVLLLDEPLAALDQRLKEQMLIELIDLQERLGTTFIYVTHDQNEALTVADRMAILNTSGRIEQMGPPKSVYEFPTSCFVANFVGKTNIITGKLHLNDQHELELEVPLIDPLKVYTQKRKNWMIPGCHAFLSIRPEKIRITKETRDGFSNAMQGVVKSIIYYGSSTQYGVEVTGSLLIKVLQQNKEHFPTETINYEDVVNLYFHDKDSVLLEY